MIRSIVFPRVLGRSLDDLQPALELFRELGFAPGNEWHEGGSHGVEMLAPSGGIEFIAAPDAPSVDAMVEVADADAAWEIAKRLGVNIRKEIADTPYGARLFEVEVSGLRIGFLTYAKKAGETRGLEAPLDATDKRFAVVVSRFNSFITERLLDALSRRCASAEPNQTTSPSFMCRAHSRFPRRRASLRRRSATTPSSASDACCAAARCTTKSSPTKSRAEWASQRRRPGCRTPSECSPATRWSRPSIARD